MYINPRSLVEAQYIASMYADDISEGPSRIEYNTNIPTSAHKAIGEYGFHSVADVKGLHLGPLVQIVHVSGYNSMLQYQVGS